MKKSSWLGISYAPWPVADPKYLEEETVRIGVQINGKTRGVIELPKDSSEEMVVSLAKLEMFSYIENKDIDRVIYKPGRILNLILK